MQQPPIITTPSPVWLQAGLLEQLTPLNQRSVIISDQSIPSKTINQVKQRLNANYHLSFPAGEHHKNRSSKQQLDDQLAELGCGRDTTLIALGGGITLDLVGFVAATYLRGVPVIYCPTSLLAMVDACLGGKTAINTDHGKNLIGCIRQPSAVWIDPLTLATLPQSEWQNGLAEVLKHAAIADSALFDELTTLDWQALGPADWQPWIARALMIKAEIVNQDCDEHHLRHCLNFGHTLAHAIEMASDYAIPHGQAVAWGMLGESWLAQRSGLFGELARLRSGIEQFGLCDTPFPALPTHKLTAALEQDKKNRNNTQQLALIQQIGKPTDPILTPSSTADCLQALSWLQSGC